MGLLWVLLLGCGGKAPADPGLSVEQIAKHVRKDVDDRAGWAADTRAALVRAGQVPDADHVCQVLAVVEQESGVKADPEVAGLAKVVSEAIDEELARLGPVAGMTREALLEVVPEGATQSFEQDLKGVRTEQDVDRLFRRIIAHHEQRAPLVGKAARTLFPKAIERKNPIDTAGSMQVSVAFAQELGKADGLSREAVRDDLYTRAGGLRYGTARLFVHEAAYDDVKYRFADYNAGEYASRNAAFQEQLSALTGEKLALDGDLVRWTKAGKVAKEDGESMRALLLWREAQAPDLTEAELRRDLSRSREARFEQTQTWLRFKQSVGEGAVYARMPQVALESPKIRRELTTAWFADNVRRRYVDCMARR